MALAPGTRFGPYDIVAPLGAGGMGEVYRAHDTTLPRGGDQDPELDLDAPRVLKRKSRV